MAGCTSGTRTCSIGRGTCPCCASGTGRACCIGCRGPRGCGIGSTCAADGKFATRRARATGCACCAGSTACAGRRACSSTIRCGDVGHTGRSRHCGGRGFCSGCRPCRAHGTGSPGRSRGTSSRAGPGSGRCRCAFPCGKQDGAPAVIIVVLRMMDDGIALFIALFLPAGRIVLFIMSVLSVPACTCASFPDGNRIGCGQQTAISRVKCNKRSGVVIENFRHDFVRGLGIQRQARAPIHQSGNVVQAGLADG